MSATKASSLGARGTIPLSNSIIEGARELARSDYSMAEANEFSVEEVRDTLLPSWLEDPSAVLPLGDLQRQGLALLPNRPAHLYATCGIESHEDHMDGLSVCVVLHADGFTFKQGRTSLKLSAGDWFIFDDRLPHEVKDTSKSTTLLVVTAALSRWRT